MSLGLNLSKFDFTPSLLLSLDDPILSTNFLRLCVESYSGSTTFQGSEYLDCMFMSPQKAPEDILRQFPSTKIMTASNDPLRDQGTNFALKLL
jgi:hormone-sensitive lipase